MVRKKNDVLKSITLLLGEVSRVSRQENFEPTVDLSYKNEGRPDYISKQQVGIVTDALLKSTAMGAGAGAGDRRALEAVVERTLTAAIQVWTDKCLRSIVDEVVEHEVARVQQVRSAR